jgi:hypothetical protein
VETLWLESPKGDAELQQMIFLNAYIERFKYLRPTRIHVQKSIVHMECNTEKVY